VGVKKGFFHTFGEGRVGGKINQFACIKESIIDQPRGPQISPTPSFLKKGIAPFYNGGQEGFGFCVCPIAD
jgi:hypothetical protein